MGSHRVGYDWSDLAAVPATAELCSILQLLFLLGTTFLFFFPGFNICIVCFSIFLLFMVLTLIQICSQAVYLFPQYLVQSLSGVQLFPTPRAIACQASLSITNSLSLLKLMAIESMMSSNHLILCHPFLFLPSISPSIREFSNESLLHIRWPEYWGFSFSISPFNEFSGLISFRTDWFDLLAVQGTLKSLLQHHSVKASILWCLAFSGPTLTCTNDYWKYHSFD